MKVLHTVSWIVLIIGGLNWLLVVLGVDLATWGLPLIVTKIVYVLVGLSAILQLATGKKYCRECGPSANQTPAGTV